MPYCVQAIGSGDKTVAAEYDFIVNPKARSGMGEMIWKRLEPELKKRRVLYRVHMTAGQGDAEKTSRKLTTDGKRHILVVLGGDGTINEAVNGIQVPAKTTLGYIPIGSSNDFARGLEIPKEPEEALGAILAPQKIIKMDIGELIREGKTRRFLVSAGMGFDAAVCHEVCVSKWKGILNRLGLGKFSYTIVALHRLMKDKPVDMTLTAEDGTCRKFERTYFVAFMNLKYEGGGFKFCPEAVPGDGMLDVMVVSGISKLKMLFVLPSAFWGGHVKVKGVTTVKCAEVTAEASCPMPLHTDGEPGFSRRVVKATILPEKLSVIVS